MTLNVRERVFDAKMAANSKTSSVKDILIEMKTLSEICVDLAFASLMYTDNLLAEQVFVIERKIDGLYIKLLDHLALSIKSQSMAEQLRIYFIIGEANNIISDSAADLASLVPRGIIVEDEIKLVQKYMEQVVDLVRLNEHSILCGESELSADIHDLIGVDIVGIIRSDDGFYTDYNEIMRPGDLLIFRAPVECANEFIKLAKGEYHSVDETRLKIIEKAPTQDFSDLKKHQKMLVEMKETAELLVDYAYIYALEGIPTIKRLILRNEEKVDNLQYEIIHEVLQLYKTDTIKEKTLMAYLRMADSFEEIADAAIKIAFGVSSKHKPYRILEEVVDDSSESVDYLVISKNSPYVGKTVKEAELIDDFFQILAVNKKAGQFHSEPDENLKLHVGDALVIKEFSSPEDE